MEIVGIGFAFVAVFALASLGMYGGYLHGEHNNKFENTQMEKNWECVTAGKENC